MPRTVVFSKENSPAPARKSLQGSSKDIGKLRGTQKERSPFYEKREKRSDEKLNTRTESQGPVTSKTFLKKGSN